MGKGNRHSRGGSSRHHHASSSGGASKSTGSSGGTSSLLKQASSSTASSSKKGKNSSTTNENKIGNSSLSWVEWCYAERHGLAWVFTCALLGSLLGLGIGTGHFTGAANMPSPWRERLGSRIRQTYVYEHIILQWTPLGNVLELLREQAAPGDRRGGGEGKERSKKKQKQQHHSLDDSEVEGGSSSKRSSSGSTISSDRSNPRAYQLLRDWVAAADGGYVHPSIGFLVPAPCGASRGLGMVEDNNFVDEQYSGDDDDADEDYKDLDGNVNALHCPYDNQRIINGLCWPPSEQDGRIVENEIKDNRKKETKGHHDENVGARNHGGVNITIYEREQIVLTVPLAVQMTRKVALQTLSPLLPSDVLARSPLEDLSDATLLVLLLAHERGLGSDSLYFPYIATLPYQPTCGYSPVLRSASIESVASLGIDIGMDVNGWPTELMKAYDYAERISAGLARDYGNYISKPRNVKVQSLIQWALCQVASRAVAGRVIEKGTGVEQQQQPGVGTLRLIPMVDMINHDVTAAPYLELTGEERVVNGDLMDATEKENGSFIVRSMRHGRPLPLMKGQELLANYNVPGYSSLDWFINMGFVPPERTGRWIKIENALPRVRLTPPEQQQQQQQQQQRPRQ